MNPDVVVVGGGPAGLSTARTVAARGWKTLVLERQQSIGDPVHTSGATAIQTVRRFGIPDDLHHPVRRIRFCSPTREAAFEYAEPVMSILDVRGVYRLLAERARAAGAEVRVRVAAQAPVLEDGRVVGCRVDGGHVTSRVLVDGSGYTAALSKRAGLHPGFRRFGVGAEYDLVAPNVDEDEAVLVVGSRYAPSGYAWVFPWGRNRVRVGVGLHHADVRDDPKELLDVFMRETGSLGVDLSGHEVAEYHYGLVPADGLPARFAGDGIVAVGDAACQATLVVGEGIRISIVAGELAGRVIADALDAGRVDAEALAPYERAFRREFGRNLRIGRFVNRRMAQLSDAQWDAKTEVLRGVPPDVLLRLLQSEFSIADLVRRPRLWPEALRLGVGAARGLRARPA